MQIERNASGDLLVLSLIGRFDAHWADLVGSSIQTAIHAGEHVIDVDLTAVDYLSSAGLAILLKYQRQLNAVNGRLRVRNPTKSVLNVLELCRVADLLLGPPDPEGHRRSTDEPALSEQDGCRFEAYAMPSARSLTCRLVGDPDGFARGVLNPDQGAAVRVSAHRFCLGLGGFAGLSEGTVDLFGEALGVAGLAIQQPPVEGHLPDFQQAQGDLIPELRLIYGLAGRGDFSGLLRFEAGSSPRGTLAFSALVERALAESRAPAVAVVVLAESQSVVGAALIRSPLAAAGHLPWQFPEVRDWLAFAGEPAGERGLALIVGLACREPDAAARPFLRPFGAGEGTLGHFHAAVLPYRPLPKGRLTLAAAVADLVEAETAEAVLHLIADDRAFEGVGETELLRGACWFGPLTSLKRD